jgi:hypothetical protein
VLDVNRSSTLGQADAWRERWATRRMIFAGSAPSTTLRHNLSSVIHRFQHELAINENLFAHRLLRWSGRIECRARPDCGHKWFSIGNSPI